MSLFQRIRASLMRRRLRHEIATVNTAPQNPQGIEPGQKLLSKDRNYPGQVEAFEFHPALTPFICRQLGRPFLFEDDVWECWFNFGDGDRNLVYINAVDLEVLK